jgi:hypothetical protein
MNRVVLIFCSLAVFNVAAADRAETSTTKRWAVDLPAFLNEQPGRWVVGRSDQPALSADEAQTLARRDAARALAADVSARLTRPVGRRDGLAARVAEALGRRDDCIVDRQIDSTERPYGTIWRAAVLVDASPAKIDALARQIDQQARRQHGRVVGGTLASCALTALAGGFYVFANWLTRGFFRGRLLVASLLIVAAGTFAVVNVI